MLIRTLAAAAVLAFGAVPLAAQADAERKGSAEIELTGRVIDVNCYITGVSGSSHRQCAQACAKAGVALAILGRDGNIYIPVSSRPGDPQNSRLYEFAQGKVTVKGIHRFANGLHTIEIQSVAAR
jgi:myo-inositol-hexaphosphate 3-phosphohydrolase